MEEQLIEGKANVSMDNTGILTMKMLHKSDIHENDAVEICKVAEGITKDKIHCNLVDISEMTFISKKAREVFASQEKKTIKAVAIVSNSMLHKSLLNLYFKFSNPSIPTKVFGDKEKAKDWLNKNLK